MNEPCPFPCTNKTEFGYCKTKVCLYAPTIKVTSMERTNYDRIISKTPEELAEGRPVIYGGLKSDGSGHSFILDGYKDGLFHVNWGGLGYNNDYFSLNQMDPEGEGNGYNREQDAIIGISPYYIYNDSPAGSRADNRVYDLTRGFVQRASLKKGIYIINGRKIAIK